MSKIDNRKISVKYEKDGSSYEVLLASDKLFFFQKAAELADIRKLPESEELIAALTELSKAQGIGLTIERQKNGKYNDGPNGEPGRVRYNAAGAISSVFYYRDGNYNDGPNGEPACQIYTDEGQPRIIDHYNNGVRNDGPNGEPAHISYDDNGQPRNIQYYNNGEPHDGPNGEPGKETRQNGELSSTVHYNGDGTHVVNLYMTGKLYETSRYMSNGWGLTDGPHGEPARQIYSEGRLLCVDHCKDGWSQDTPDGTPAVQVYNRDGELVRAERFDNRQCVSIEHFKDNKRNDSPDGEPALQHFGKNGKLEYAERFKDGVSQGKLSWVKKKTFAHKQKQKKLGF